jgi:hypothetical protein
MNTKKSLANRIKGWFPATPTLPQNQKTSLPLQNAKTLVKPLPPLLENKFQRNGGIIIGMGVGLLMIGSIGASFSYQTYSQVARFLTSNGEDINNYVLRDMLELTAIYLTIIIMGIYAVVFGLLALRSQFFREITLNKGPYSRLGGGLIGGGGALFLGSFRNLFTYLLAIRDPRINNLELQLFAIFFLVGAFLMISGFLAWRKKK